MTRLNSLLLLLLLVIVSPPAAAAQGDVIADAKAAIATADYARAIGLLSQSVARQPSADGYLYLGISYGHTREWKKAEDTLKEGTTRYPQDPRFHNELAGVYLAANDLDNARQSLHHALDIDPKNKYATDLLATVDMSMGNVRAALASWNKDGRPVVGDILHNSHLQFENWTVGKAVAFHKGKTLTWAQWRTTEVRLLHSEMYANVGVEIEPTKQPDTYTVVIRTVPKATSVDQYILPMLESAFFQYPKIRFANVGNSGINLSTGWRYAVNRHRGEIGINAPLPVPGLFAEAQGIFRSERWDISRPAIDNGTDYRFRFQSTGFRAMVRSIPHYRVELGAGFEYRNRTSGGAPLPALSVNSQNSGKMLFEASVLPADGRYRSRIHGETFLARKNILGDMNYSGGTLEWNNRYVVAPDGGMNVDVTLKGGTSRGNVPVDDYFVLGLGQSPDNLLRGHNSVSYRGHFGHAPMGTSFALVNTTLDHRMRRFPIFNTLNVPFADLKWQFFADAGKSWDRAHVFNAGKLLVDVGGGFKLETPTRVFNVTYGRSLRDGTGTLAAFIQKRW